MWTIQKQLALVSGTLFLDPHLVNRMSLLTPPSFPLYPTQDLDRIAEANELFDAVLTGSVDRDKKVSTNVAPTQSKETPAKEKDNQESMKTQKGGNTLKRLSLYIGNFPWVSHTCLLWVIIHFLLLCLVQFLFFSPHSQIEQCTWFSKVVPWSQIWNLSK